MTEITLESAARLAALRDKADGVTGESSATLAGAVDALIAGFGAGGESLSNVLVLVADFAGADSLNVLFGAYDGTKQAVVS